MSVSCLLGRSMLLGSMREGPIKIQFFFVGSCARPTARFSGKTGPASLNRFRPTTVGSQQGICTPYPNVAGIFRLGEPVETMSKDDAQIDTMDEASDTYVASNLYEDEDLEINVGVSPSSLV